MTGRLESGRNRNKITNKPKWLRFCIHPIWGLNTIEAGFRKAINLNLHRSYCLSYTCLRGVASLDGCGIRGSMAFGMKNGNGLYRACPLVLGAVYFSLKPNIAV